VFSGEAVAYFFQFTIRFSQGRSSINCILNLRKTALPAEAEELEAEKDTSSSPASEPLEKGSKGKDIAFRDVDFSYPLRQNVRVLQDINMDASTGQMIAFIGASGCVKSTMIALLQRFYDPTTGTIHANGKPLKEFSRCFYRHDVALVQEEPVLCQGSFRENISLGIQNGEPTEEDIINACIQSNIWQFVESLSDGLATHCGSQGYSLSGESRQRSIRQRQGAP
jgi:ATP-binding cassette subfamily B (MDR/TAP) protein 1